MAELLNLTENSDEILEKYDVEMEQYLKGRDRHIGTTAFEALAVESTSFTIEAATQTGSNKTGPNAGGQTDDTPTDVAPGVL